MKRSAKVGIGAAVVVALGASAPYGYFQLVKAGVLRYNEFDRRERGELRVGGVAPDIALKMYDGSPIRLAELWAQKPVFLVFGSCT
jgi:hypothetical protein